MARTMRWLSACLLLASCAAERDTAPAPAGEVGAGSGSGAPVADAGELGSGAADVSPGERPEDALEGVSLTVEIGALPRCPDAAECTEDYGRFVTLAAAYAGPQDLAALPLQLREIDAGNQPQVAPRLASEALRDEVIEGLGIGFLLADLPRRTLQVRVISEVDRGSYSEQELLLTDPWVGEFGALLLQPKLAERRAALLAVHGHGDTKEVYRDEYHGAEHAPRGYTTLILGMRAMGSGPSAITEHVITRELYRAGFSLMGMRVYESLLGLKFLRSLPTVEADKVALIGHSGGSSTGNLTVRVDPTIAGYVSDHQVAYAEWVAGINVYHCETVPSLFGYSEQLNDPADSPVPTLKVPYKYTNGMEELFTFLDGQTAP